MEQNKSDSNPTVNQAKIDNFTITVLVIYFLLIIGPIFEQNAMSLISSSLIYLFLYLALPIMIYRDAKNHRLYLLRYDSQYNSFIDRFSPGIWALMVLLITILFVPIYLIKRKNMINEADRIYLERKDKGMTERPKEWGLSLFFSS